MPIARRQLTTSTWSIRRATCSLAELVIQNTSTLGNKTIKWIGHDEFAVTTPVINAKQTSRVFDILGMKGATTNLSLLFQGLAIEGGLATDDGGLPITQRLRRGRRALDRRWRRHAFERDAQE